MRKVWVAQDRDFYRIFETEEEANKFADLYNSDHVFLNKENRMHVYEDEICSKAEDGIRRIKI